MLDPAFLDWNLAPAARADAAPDAAAAQFAQQEERLRRRGWAPLFSLPPASLGLGWLDASGWLVGCGNPEVLRQPALAVVGTREPAHGELPGLESWLTDLFAQLGLAIVSGGARGIDRLAHRAALRAGLPTVAVLAGGLLHAGPAANRDLFSEMVAAGGCLLTEQPLGCRPFETQFVARNRTIAGLALGTLVVRAPEQSGALTTAGFARRMGRPVAVVPGAPWEPSAAGSNALLRRGGVAVGSARELADLLGTGLRSGKLPLPLSERLPEAQQPIGLSEAATRLWMALTGHFEEGDLVVERAGLGGGEALAALTELEMEGLVERSAGRWRRAQLAGGGARR